MFNLAIRLRKSITSGTTVYADPIATISRVDQKHCTGNRSGATHSQTLLDGSFEYTQLSLITTARRFPIEKAETNRFLLERMLWQLDPSNILLLCVFDSLTTFKKGKRSL